MREWAAVLILLAACSLPVPSASSGAPAATGYHDERLEAPDSSEPAAGICLDPQPGGIATFQLNSDTPDPRCGRVLPSQRLRVVNGTATDATVTLHGVDYLLQPGTGQTFGPAFGVIWRPGVHSLLTSVYNGAGPEIWLVAE